MSWSRYILILVVFVLVAGGVGVRMVSIQNIPAAQTILESSKKLVGVTQTIYPERGSIYDAQGRLLAGNETVYEVGLDLRSIAQPETIASVVSNVLGLDYSTTLVYAKTEAIDDEKLYIVLDSFVDKEKIAQLELIEEDYKNAQSENETRPSCGMIWDGLYNKSSYTKSIWARNAWFLFLPDRVDGRGYYGVKNLILTWLARRNKCTPPSILKKSLRAMISRQAPALCSPLTGKFKRWWSSSLLKQLSGPALNPAPSWYTTPKTAASSQWRPPPEWILIIIGLRERYSLATPLSTVLSARLTSRVRFSKSSRWHPPWMPAP
jgi:hypothetical protein